MPEAIYNKSVFSLLEVSKSIQKTIFERYKTPVWIRAELNKLNYYSRSGHCFPELVEKENGKLLAQMKATIWNEDYSRINQEFRRVLGEPLKDGIKILFQATISFDPAYGLALRISDIDPSFTLGDLEREKQETIQRLQKEDLYNRNKSLQLALLPQRMAIISVETSKGYADFIKVLEENPYGYRFFHMLFPSILQGDHAIPSMTKQLNLIRKVKDHFDLVIIVRGGGDDAGLSCYNDYRLAKEIAAFPLPVLTGIGHSTNETVCEMIAYANAITPTKLAEWFLQKFHHFREPLEMAGRILKERSSRLINEKKSAFRAEVKLFRSVSKQILQHTRSNLNTSIRSLHQQSVYRFRSEQMTISQSHRNLATASYRMFKEKHLQLLHMMTQVKNMSPENVLKRGYSITLLNGKSLRTVSGLKKGDQLLTKIYKGTVSSIVQSAAKSENNE